MGEWINMDSVLESIDLLPKQCESAWQESQKMELSKSLGNCSSLVISGMGASCFGYYILKTLLGRQLKIPVVLSNGYHLPGFVNSHTLVISQSYSGDTEETVSTLLQAISQQVPVTGTTSGGQLANIFSSYKLPFYKFNTDFNPSGQPRYGSGYTIFGLLGILKAGGIITLSDDEILPAINFIQETQVDQKTKAQNIAGMLSDKQPLIIASQHLSGNAHILRNQFHESSKNFSDYSLLPELNHHLLEGLAYPKKLKETLIILALKSNLYEEKILKRLELTLDVVDKNNLKSAILNIEGDTLLKQVLGMLSFGSYLSYYLAIRNKVNPQEISWVDYFKEKL